MHRQVRRLLTASAAFAVAVAVATPVTAGVGPNDPFFVVDPDTVAPGGTFVMTEVTCGSVNNPTVTVELATFPNFELIATGNADLNAGTGSVDVPPDTPFGEYRLSLDCDDGEGDIRGFTAAVFVAEPSAPQPLPPPVVAEPSAPLPVPPPVVAGPQFTG